MDKTALAKAVYETCHLKGQFVLRSGQTSGEYFDKYLFESRPELLEDVVAHMVPLVPKGTEILAGLEMGGIPVAVAISLKTRLRVLFVRKKAKEYGTRKLAEGVDFRGKRVTVIEDVVTTGGAVVDGVTVLRGQGAVIEDVLCVIDRESGGAEKLGEHKLRLISLFTESSLKAAARPPAKV